MNRSSVRFSPRVLKILQEADLKLRLLSGGQHYALYNYWRAAMAKICRVDAFYVAFLVGEDALVFPYNYDGREYDNPEMHTFGPDGVAAWVFARHRPYVYAQDNGLLLHRGVSFGDRTRVSADAVTVPLLEETEHGRKAIGLAGMQTYQPHSYTAEHVEAFVVTANSVATVLRREKEDADERDRLLGEPATAPSSVADVVDEVSLKLRLLKRKIDSLLEVLADDGSPAEEMVRDLQQVCEQVQTETMEILTRRTADAQSVMRSLTPREREIALLIADGLDNNEIAERLDLSIKTVKTHVTHVHAKFGVRQRAAVMARLRPLL